MLETSSRIFTVLEIFMVLATLGNFQSWRLLLEIFMVLETSLEGFSWCWRLLLGFSLCLRLLLETSLEGFSRYSRFLLGFSQFWRLLWRNFHSAGDFFGEIFTVLETSSGDFKVCESSDSIEAIFKVLETFPW